MQIPFVLMLWQFVSEAVLGSKYLIAEVRYIILITYNIIIIVSQGRCCFTSTQLPQRKAKGRKWALGTIFQAANISGFDPFCVQMN